MISFYQVHYQFPSLTINEILNETIKSTVVESKIYCLATYGYQIKFGDKMGKRCGKIKMVVSYCF